MSGRTKKDNQKEKVEKYIYFKNRIVQTHLGDIVICVKCEAAAIVVVAYVSFRQPT